MVIDFRCMAHTSNRNGPSHLDKEISIHCQGMQKPSCISLIEYIQVPLSNQLDLFFRHFSAENQGEFLPHQEMGSERYLPIITTPL